MADQDANERERTAVRQNQIEAQQHPRQVHGLETGAKPKVNYHIFVQLAPNVQHRQDHWVHEKLKIV